MLWAQAGWWAMSSVYIKREHAEEVDITEDERLYEANLDDSL